jgi:putative DNA primase/helicase
MNGDFARHIGDIARAILGEPNTALSTRFQLRFGQHGSIAVDIRGPKAGSWYDHENEQGGGPWDLIHIKLGKVDGEAIAWLKTIGIEIDPRPGFGRIVATYDYPDESGKLLFQVVRFEPKDFKQRRPDGAGGWVWNTKGVRRVLYRLPELLAAPLETCVYIPEGEKDVDNLTKLGLVATCNPGGATKQKPGASKWPTSFGVFFRSRNVIILPDNDKAGHEHAEAIARNIAPLAGSTRILDLAEDCSSLPSKGDVSDWLAAGGGRDRLERLAEAAPPFQAPPTSSKTPASAADNTEDALALEFTRRHAHELRYCAAWGRWMLWNGNRWVHETTLRAFDLARTVVRDVDANRSAKTIAAVERIAQSDRQHAATPDQWDGDDWLFNQPARTLELKTGIVREHRHDDYITKIAGCPVDHDCPTPLWRQFLDTVAPDEELQGYLRRVAGYCLTASIREHVLFFFYGTGANGKGVFLNTLRGIWGDYAVVAPMETFIESQSDRHPTELAHLRGARLVIAQETERGRRWAENKIKSMTGGDPISARYMRQDFFEFTPQFKLMIAGNHKPTLRGVDEAIRRRFHLIPFTVTIPPKERDKDLAHKLKPEWGGILRWAVDGCLEWQQIGLSPPPAVLHATDQYLKDEDTLGQWIDERCAVDPAYSAFSSDLYHDWKQWTEARGERPGSQKRFSEAVGDRGFNKQHERAGNMFYGIALRPV